MEFIDEYLQKRDYIELKSKLQAKQDKLITRPKKHVTTASLMVLKPKTIGRIKRRITKSISIMAAKRSTEANLKFDTLSSYSSTHNGTKSLSQLLTNKSEIITQTINAAPIAIDRYAAFEKQIRKNFSEDFLQYHPESAHAVKQVLDLMFETVDNSFTETLRIAIKEIKIVPVATAKYMNAKLTFREQVHNLIKKDLKTERRYNAMPKSAFGTTFRNNFKVETKANDFKNKWQYCTKYREDLETFAAVWQDITHLQSTLQFCKWLTNNPNVKPPVFLKNEGHLKRNFNYVYSIRSNSICEKYDSEETESFISQSTKDSSSDDSLNSIVSNDTFDINILV